MRDFLHHLFLPRESNNHKAKVLHHSSLLLITIFLFTVQLILNFGQTNFSHVLGEAVNITTQELIDLTNQKRQEKGLTPLVINEELSKAALEKAKHMFANNYWAHTSQDGTTPWVFIKGAGYSYVYAGENLARGFTNSNSVVDAWMESPSHKENMLSANYRDIGFAVLQGKLLGEDTTLVVEMFGSSSNQAIARAPRVQPQTQQIAASVSATIPQPQIANANNSLASSKSQSLAFSSIPSNSVRSNPLINIDFLTKNLTLTILSVLLFVMVSDILIIERKKIVRSFTHNIDHMIFFGIFFVLVIILSKGIIL